MYTSAKPYFYGTGRRKKSVARVRIVPGTGVITVNKKTVDEYFGLETLKLIINQPFETTGTVGKFDIIANVNGGGLPDRQERSVTDSPAHSYRQTRHSSPPSRQQASSLVTLV